MSDDPIDLEIDLEPAPEPSSPTKGWRPSPEDARDFSYEQLMRNSQLKARTTNLLSAEGTFGAPTRVDLRNKFFPIRNQGWISSCVGYGSASIQEFFNVPDAELKEYLSPQFIYNLREDPTTEGMYLRDACKILRNSGVSRDKLFPHGTSGRPETSVRKDAEQFRIASYARIWTLDGIKAALASGSPVLFGCECYNNNGNFWIPKSGDVEGGHCTTLVGFDDVLEELFFRNSWGTDWGENGYGKISTSDFRNLKWAEMWAFVDLDNSGQVSPIPLPENLDDGEEKESKGCSCILQ